MNKKFIAFTMAEVLIVAAIIGVIGALTIPNVKKSYEEKANIAKAKSAFMKFDSALRHVDMNDVLNGKTTNEERSLALYNAMSAYLKLSVSCGTQTDSNYCFTKSAINDSKNFQNFFNPVTKKNECSTGILNDGTEFALCIQSNLATNPGYNPCSESARGELWIDVDGANKGANTRGSDLFAFCVSEEGLAFITSATYRGAEDKIFIDNELQ